MQFAEAMKESGVVTTSSPGAIPAMLDAEVQPGRAARHGGDVRRADALGKRSSKRSIIGPNARRPERSTSRRASSSASSTYGAERPIGSTVGAHASAGAAFPIFAYSSHCAQRSLLPRHVSRYAV